MMRCFGFTLVEALVSLLVLSIGLLGLVRLQAALSQSEFELHASLRAHRLGASGIAALRQEQSQENIEDFEKIQSPSTHFSVARTVVNEGRSGNLSVGINWKIPQGSRRLELRARARLPVPEHFARLLLSEIFPQEPPTAR